MWRSLFLAVGIFTVIVGFESMVVDQVVMTNARRIPKLVSGKARQLVNATTQNPLPDQPAVLPIGSANSMPTLTTPSSSLPNSLANSRLLPAKSGPRSAYGPSAYGPTNYSGTQAGTFNRVLEKSQKPANRTRMGFARFPKPGINSNNRASGLANTPAQPVAAAPLAATPVRVRRPRVINTKDWMPWSLLAVGTIIILYTQSRGRPVE